MEGWSRDERGSYCGRCGGTVGPFEADGEGCGSCRQQRLPWEKAIRLGPYSGLLRDAVMDLKFHRWRQTGAQLGRALGQVIGEELDRAQVPRSRAVLVPVPTHWRRRVSRGVDHTWVLARAAEAGSGVEVRRALARRFGPSQVEVSASERRSNVSGVFVGRGRGVFEREVTVVLDDVRTTGATLRAAVRALGLGGSGDRVWVATVAVTPIAGRREGGVGVLGSVSIEMGGEK
jgi:predicted amidophosphoribosyltransferase